ncbi:MAG: carboxypeptidase regulatory-like domain-containing protein [Acidobacteriota bacterium]
MHGSSRHLLLAIALVLAAAAAARAADTGTVSGAVFDQNGEPVAEATVRIAGDRLPSGRTVQTSGNGVYLFDYLASGEYAVDVEKTGIGTARRAAIVGVGKDTQVDFVLGLSVTEALTVVAATPVVDVRSTEVSFNFTSDTLNRLPLERTYRGLFQLIPGVADNRSTVGPAAGGSRQDNTYLIDGANITNPGFGYLGTEINELDIAEVNLKRAGISAEFGRTGGSVTNAVSRSGSNRFSGIGRIDWLPEKLVGAYKLPEDLLAAGVRPGTFRDALLTTERGPAAGLGGPIIRDRVFFYGSARYSSKTKWDRFNKVAALLPDETRTGPEFYGKLTAAVAQSHQATLGYRHRPSHVENAGITSDYAASVATTTDNGSRIATAEWAHFIGARTSLNLRYLFMKENNEDVPVRNLGYLPVFNPGNLAAMGQYIDPTQANLIVGANQYANIQNYRRHEVRGTFGHLFDIGGSSHALKAGGGYEFGEETLNRLANGWGLLANITQGGVAAVRARYFTPQAAQLGQGRTYSVFVQDDISIANRLSVNAGVLLDRDDFSQELAGSGGCPSTVVLTGGAAIYQSHGDRCDFLRFGFADEVQPRLGVSYQVRAGKSDKVYAHWGRYYNMDQKSSGRSLAPSRIFQTQTVFDLSGAILSSGPLASTTGKMIDPDLKPIYTDEVLIGYATPVADLYSVDVFFMTRRMNNFIEDVPSRMNGTAPDSGPFVAVNLPCARFAACRSADARRTYRAVTVDLRRRLASGWMSDVSYTWSRFEGNYDLDYSPGSVFNTSSFIQDGPGTNVEDPNRFGPLLEDRPHVFKVFSSYTATSRLTASGYLRVQSGTPWAARGRDWAGATLNYLEPAGSHRNPTWANLDLMTAYRLPLNGRTSVSIEARLLNVFDNQTRLSTDAQQYLDLRTTPAPPYFEPYQQLNPFFAAGSGFAPPRRLYIAAVASF